MWYVLVLLALALLYYVKNTDSRRKMLASKFNGPKANFIFGNAYEFLNIKPTGEWPQFIYLTSSHIVSIKSLINKQPIYYEIIWNVFQLENKLYRLHQKMTTESGLHIKNEKHRKISRFPANSRILQKWKSIFFEDFFNSSSMAQFHTSKPFFCFQK